MTIIFVVLNGPPKSGKSTIAAELVRMFNEKHRAISDSFAAPMKHFIATALAEKYSALAKDSPLDVLSGRSPREFLISLSEDHMKEEYGQDIFGRLLTYRALRYSPPPDIVVIDDSGFPSELNAIHNHVLVKVIRPGHDYSNDSRVYLPDPHYELWNDTTLDELWVHCRTLVNEIIAHANWLKPGRTK